MICQRRADQLFAEAVGWGTDLLFSYKSVISITHEQKIICSKTLICGQLFAGHIGGLSANEKKGKRTSNDNIH